MVQFLWLLAPIALIAIALTWLLRVLSKRSPHRDHFRHREEPDFSQFERDEDDDVVLLTAVHADDDFSSFERGDDSDLLFAEPLGGHKFADGNYDPLSADVPHAVEITSIVEPLPLFGTRISVRQSCMRAARQMERCAHATYDRHDFAEAEAFARAALREVNQSMKRDHWYAPFVINWLAYLRYEQGFTVEARDLWEQAEQIAIEWHEQCQQLLPDIRQNLKYFHENF